MKKGIRGQSSMEFMSIVGIGLVILLPLIAISFDWTTGSKDSLNVLIAEQSAGKITSYANLVHSQGAPAKTEVVLQVTDDVESINFQDNIVTFKLRRGETYTEITREADVNISGNIPITTGYHTLTIESLGDSVNVSQS